MFAVKPLGSRIGLQAGAEVGWWMAKRLAGGEVSRRRLSKLSCAGWLPHDRGFVSGLPRSRGRASAGCRLITGDEDSPPGPAARQALRVKDGGGCVASCSLAGPSPDRRSWLG